MLHLRKWHIKYKYEWEMKMKMKMVEEGAACLWAACDVMRKVWRLYWRTDAAF